MNDDFGLNLYAYGVRYYDAAIGRFTGVDPISDQFAWVSPYNYAENEPIANIDLHGLQKVSIHFLGQILLDGSLYTTAGTATLDIGNNNSIDYSIALDGLGAISGSYSKENGFQSSSGATFNFEELAFEVDRPRGIVLPKWAIKTGLKKAKDAFTPDNIDQALSLTKEDAKFNESMRFLLNSVGQLVDQDILTGLYDYDGSKGTATNKKGETYERKFTNIYKGKFNDFEFGDDGIRFKGKLVISYTEQKCKSNCDEDKK